MDYSQEIGHTSDIPATAGMGTVRGASMEEWYYALNGAQQGPVSREVLLQLLGSRQLPATSLVWREGMADWVAASQVLELSQVHPVAAAGAAYSGQSMLNYGVGDSVYAPAAGALNYAGFGIRFVAWIIDFILTFIVGAILGAVLGVVIAALAGSNALDARETARALGNILGIVLNWLYFSLMWTSPSQASLGMMATGLRVTDLNARRVTFGRATGRYFASILSGCLLGYGYLRIIWDDRKQSLHDQIAGTLVLRK